MKTTRVERLAPEAPESFIDAFPAVRTAKAELQVAQRTHAAHMQERSGPEAALLSLDRKLIADHERLARLQERLPAVSARIIEGDKRALQEEAEVLKEIAFIERAIQRAVLGRPVLDARIRALRGEGAHKAILVTESDAALERAREAARLEWAAQQLN